MKDTLFYPRAALVVYSKHWKSILQISFILAAIGLIFDVLTQLFPVFLSGLWITSLLLIIRLLALSLFNIILFWTVKNALNDRSTKFSDEISESKKRYKYYVLLTIILFIIIFAGSVLLIIPGVIFAVWYFAATYLVATEELKPMNALDLSKKRVEGKFWQVLGRILVAVLIVPVPFIIVVSALVSIGNPTTQISAYLSIFSSFLMVLLLSPYLYTIIALIYEDLKAAS
jgi:hypothetical protein